MSKERKPGSGGKRPGAGRPPGEKTVTVSFRIKEEWREPIKKVVRKEIARLKKYTN